MCPFRSKSRAVVAKVRSKSCFANLFLAKDFANTFLPARCYTLFFVKLMIIIQNVCPKPKINDIISVISRGDNMAIELNGKQFALKFESEIKKRTEALVGKLGFLPVLATIIVGNNPASVTYVNMKARACQRVGLGSQIISLDENITTEGLLKVIDDLNAEQSVCGILLQHPVPRHINEQLCFDRIAIDKDVDGVNTHSFGKITMGQKAFTSATPLGIIRLLEAYQIELEGKHAVVIGRSAILGKPISMLLLNKNCTVTICHSKTRNLPEIVKRADLVVGAVGIANFVKDLWLKPGVILIDAGYNQGNVGDIDMANCKEISSYYTPVPGGVGPMTINTLLLQTLVSAERMTKD